MKRRDKLYDIFRLDILDVNMRDHEEPEEIYQKIGEQLAVSEAQAVSRYCYKNGIRSIMFSNYEGDTGRMTYIEAKIHDWGKPPNDD